MFDSCGPPVPLQRGEHPVVSFASRSRGPQRSQYPIVGHHQVVHDDVRVGRRSARRFASESPGITVYRCWIGLAPATGTVVSGVEPPVQSTSLLISGDVPVGRRRRGHQDCAGVVPSMGTVVSPGIVGLGASRPGSTRRRSSVRRSRVELRAVLSRVVHVARRRAARPATYVDAGSARRSAASRASGDTVGEYGTSKRIDSSWAVERPRRCEHGADLAQCDQSRAPDAGPAISAPFGDSSRDRRPAERAGPSTSVAATPRRSEVDVVRDAVPTAVGHRRSRRGVPGATDDARTSGRWHRSIGRRSTVEVVFVHRAVPFGVRRAPDGSST